MRSRRSAEWDIGLIITSAIASFFVPYINGFVFNVLTAGGFIGGSFYENAFIAAITEPWVSKLFGPVLLVFGGLVGVMAALAFFIIAIVFLGRGLASGLTMFALATGPLIPSLIVPTKRFRDVDLLKKRKKAGMIVGLVFGLFELYFRMPGFTFFFWENPNFHIGLLGPVTFHLLSGSIIVTAFLTSVSPKSNKSGWYTLGAIAIASALHWIWNTWLVNPETGTFFWQFFRDIAPSVVFPLIVGGYVVIFADIGYSIVSLVD
ncbi:MULTISPECIES: hypothetical protein [Haloarcula]|uniref:hypothetical protein n=1 Tax=Haloarcula TaxID=2237 RepID=UPI0023E85C6C|nr:hypothetical protein [Halomicroarcula sp. SHR3]